MATLALNLAPLVDGYKWLRDNQQHMNTCSFLVSRKVDPSTGGVVSYLITSAELPLEKHIFVCLGTACVIADTLKQGNSTLTTFPRDLDGDGIPSLFINILQKLNPDYSGNWYEVDAAFTRLFYGQWYSENLETRLADLTIEQVKQGVIAVCEELGYVIEEEI